MDLLKEYIRIDNGLNQRKGRIEFRMGFIDSLELDMIKEFFGNFYIINVEFVGFNRVEYLGLSEHFEEVELGTLIPEYEAMFNTEDKTIKFDKV